MPPALTPAQRRFVAELVASGQYADEDEVVRAAVRLLQDQADAHAAKLAALKAAVEAGLNSGPALQVDDLDAFFAEIDAEIESEIAAEEAAAHGRTAE